MLFVANKDLVVHLRLTSMCTMVNNVLNIG